jgi:hypothetical protein
MAKDILTEPTNRRLRLRDTSLRRVSVLRFDPDSPTLADDLTHIFQRNVAKARRENKGLFGSPDGPKAKSGGPKTKE